jgi:hypothetical protein
MYFDKKNIFFFIKINNNIQKKNLNNNYIHNINEFRSETM